MRPLVDGVDHLFVPMEDAAGAFAALTAGPLAALAGFPLRFA